MKRGDGKSTNVSNGEDDVKPLIEDEPLYINAEAGNISVIGSCLKAPP